MIRFEVKGDLRKTEMFLTKMSRGDIYQELEKFAQEGKTALASATPVDSGLTAASWDYTIESSRGSHSIIWSNTHVVSGQPIAIILQYGHGTGTGGYVHGRDYINPAMRPLFDKIADNVWKAVKSA